MKYNVVLFILALLSGVFSTHAQDHSSCDGVRYRTALFTDVLTAEDVQYSQGETIGGDTVDLFLDIYEPSGDAVSHRPTIVLGFGGSFIVGTRKDIAELCKEYAKRGFVAVSIDYRLYDLPLFPFPRAEQMEEVVVKTVVDMRAALSFLVDDARKDNMYGIDTSQFFVGGVSAGSIMALHTAMLDFGDDIPAGIGSKLDDNGPIDGVTNANSAIPIQGVINFSGGLNKADWIDSDDPALFSYHDDMDPTVPYKSGFANVFGQNIIGLDGSYVLDSIAQARGVISELVTVPNSNVHVSYLLLPGESEKAIDASAKFMYKMLCSDRADVSQISQEKPYKIGPNPSYREFTLQVDAASTIEVLDISGRIVERIETAQAGEVRLSRLAKGSYILKIRMGNQRYTERVIKN
jgi:hypothetical protein